MSDLVNHPPHYTTGKVECLDAIEAMLDTYGFANYLRGQIVKYLWRAPHKGSGPEDILKAQFYMNKLAAIAGPKPEPVKKGKK